jgi:DNA-binding CsgD family transcriptional regulator
MNHIITGPWSNPRPPAWADWRIDQLDRIARTIGENERRFQGAIARDIKAASLEYTLTLVIRPALPAAITTIPGDIPSATEILQLPFDFMFFTGNTKVIKVVARAAAENLAAFRAQEAEASPFIEANVSEALLRGEGSRLAVAEWAMAVLNNGLGRYEEALAAAQRASESPLDVIFHYWALSELVEAAVRSGTAAAAAGAYARLAEMAAATASDWALGLQARSRALLTDGEEAEELYQRSIEHLGRTRMRAELARARLLYGEWLRRQPRPGDARDQLRTALDMLEAMGMKGFAERARRELRATGETRARKRSLASHSELTAQEAQVAKLARDGLSNPEIGARLYISARTAQYHLGKVFTKLNITSRSQLEHVLT